MVRKDCLFALWALGQNSERDSKSLYWSLCSRANLLMRTAFQSLFVNIRGTGLLALISMVYGVGVLLFLSILGAWKRDGCVCVLLNTQLHCNVSCQQSRNSAINFQRTLRS